MGAFTANPKGHFEEVVGNDQSHFCQFFLFALVAASIRAEYS
jgi:hypothetical protein